MRGIVTAAAGAAFAAVVVPWVTVARAAAVTRVPCASAALAGAISGAAAGSTLSLAPRCTYVLTSALPQVSQDLTIVGNHATLLRAAGSAVPAFTILSLTAGSLTLSQLSFRNGRGAISVTGFGALTVNGGTFAGNSAANGGAIDDDNTALDGPQLTGVTFTGNSATGSGGAVYDNAAGAGVSTSGCTFTGNTAGQDGGAIWDFSIGNEIDSSKFRGNSSGGSGGAILDSEDSGGGFRGDSVTASVAGGAGAGIYAPEGGNGGISVAGSTVSGNRAGGNGGGLWLPVDGSVVTGSTLRGNSAADGGAIFADQFNVVTMSGDDIVANRASGDGGGLYDDGPGDESSLSIATTTFFANRAAGRGGALFNGVAAVPVTGSLVTGNLAAGGGGGIYDDTGQAGSVTLTNTPVTRNHPDNCQPAGSISGCAG